MASDGHNAALALPHPIHYCFGTDDAGLVAHVEQAADGFAAVGAVVEGAFVHVHADELVGRLRVEIAGKLHGVSQRFFTMIEAVLDAFAESRGDGSHQLGSEGAANGVAAERKRKAGHLSPPLAEIDHAVEARLVIGQLAFVNDESSLVLAFEYLRDDLIKGNHFGFHSGREQLQCEIGSGERAGHGDLASLDLARR